MKLIFPVLQVFLFSVTCIAQSEDERNAIKSFCGCFDVTFEYAETFPRVDEYQLAKPYKARATEYVVLEEESDNKLVLQHLLIINDSTIIKHWRQDWEYEPDQTFAFHGNKTWEVNLTDGARYGQWSQEVYEVDDAPRYSGIATWSFLDGKRVWESTTDAPLPRREYTTRNDYQILRRANRLHIEDWGWVHEQDNEKIVIDGDKRYVLVEEKGHNVYTRTDPEKCAAAGEYWKKHRDFWSVVRDVWESRMAVNGVLVVQQVTAQSSRSETLDELSAQAYVNEREAYTAVDKALAVFIMNGDVQR